MGVSRQRAHRWVARFDAEGEAGLHDRSSRPHRSPTKTPRRVERRVVAARREHRRGQDWLLAGELGVLARTISRILRRRRDHDRGGDDRQRLEYTKSPRFTAILDRISARHLVIKPHCPWPNGKIERSNRTLQAEWAYRHIFATNDERTTALAPWLEIYNTRRRHSALGGRPPISRLSPT